MGPNNTIHTLRGHLADTQATIKLGAQLAHAIAPGMVIYLIGDLGAGKTTFVRGFLAGLGYQGKVKSPTYTLVESYPFPHMTIHHFDLYRFTNGEEWNDTGLSDNFCDTTLCLVEWPEKAEGFLPVADIQIELTIIHPEGRHYLFRACTQAGNLCLHQLVTLADAHS